MTNLQLNMNASAYDLHSERERAIANLEFYGLKRQHQRTVNIVYNQEWLKYCLYLLLETAV